MAASSPGGAGGRPRSPQKPTHECMRALPLLAGRPSPHLPSTQMLRARPFTRQHCPSPRLLSPQLTPLLWPSAPPRAPLGFLHKSCKHTCNAAHISNAAHHAMQHTMWAEVLLLWTYTQTRKSGSEMGTALKRMPAKARGQGEYAPLSPVFPLSYRVLSKCQKVPRPSVFHYCLASRRAE